MRSDAMMSPTRSFSPMATLTHVSTATTNKTVVGFTLLGGFAVAAMVLMANSVYHDARAQAPQRDQFVPIVEEQKTIPTEDS